LNHLSCIFFIVLFWSTRHFDKMCGSHLGLGDLLFNSDVLQSHSQIFIPLAHKSLETAKTIHKILVNDLIIANLQFCSIEKYN
jgi:hypothetical protein